MKSAFLLWSFGMVTVMQTFLVEAHGGYDNGYHMMSMGHFPFVMGLGWVFAFILLIVLIVIIAKR